MLIISKEWLYGEGEESKYFTLEQLLGMQEVLEMDRYQFAEYITGYDCDSYADTSCDIMAEYYEGDNELCYENCMKDERFLTCYTTYRLWNATHTEEQALFHWKESCMGTIEGYRQA